MMRSAVETHADAAFGKQRVCFREWIRFTRKVACAEQRNDARDVSLQRKGSKIPMQLDMIVELLRNTGRLSDFRDGTGGLGSQLKPALDLPDFLCVLIDGPLIRCSQTLLQAL